MKLLLQFIKFIYFSIKENTYLTKRLIKILLHKLTEKNIVNSSDNSVCRIISDKEVYCVPDGNVIDLFFLSKNKFSVGCRSPPIPNLTREYKFKLEETKVKNFRESDYARNKYSQNIVYKFTDKVVEVSLEDYLKQNPDRTADDFAKLKALSDDIYHKQDLNENRTSRRDVSIDLIDEKAFAEERTVLQDMIEREDKEKALLAAKELLEKGKLTEIQKRRFIQHYFQGISMRKIAKCEGIQHSSVVRSLELARIKLKNIFEKISF